MFFLGSPLTLTYKIDDPLVIKMFVIPLHGNREGGYSWSFGVGIPEMCCDFSDYTTTSEISAI